MAASRGDWHRALGQLRYDLVREDPLQAHKELGAHTALELYLDNSLENDPAQLRLVITRLIDSPQSSRRRSSTGREYQLFTDRTYVTMVVYQLQPEDDFALVLAEIEREFA